MTARFGVGVARRGVRILAVGIGGDLTLNKATLSGGRSSNCGGVYNVSGALTLSNSTISGNSGGGVCNRSLDYIPPYATLSNCVVSGNTGVGVRNGRNTYAYYMTLTNCTVSDNTGTGIVNGGLGSLTITNSLVSGNTGGGVSNYAKLTIANSTVSGNSSSGNGGGIENVGGQQRYGGGDLTLTGSVVSGNTATLAGGGVFNDTALVIRNSTVSDNSASHGGGVFNTNYINYSVGVALLENSTVSGNIASINGGGILNTGEYARNTVTLARTLVSGNTAPTGPEIYNSSHYGYRGVVTANNYNLFGHDGDAGVVGFSTGLTDIVPSEPLSAILDPLADNGGPTQTHALVSGSPAVDTSPVYSDCPPIDQRGVSRPQGPACDIGAFEQGPPLRCDGKIVRILGTVGNDNLIGTPGPDVLHGLGGRDVIRGLAGNDSLCGGTQDDSLFGGSGSDKMLGGSGNDVCDGGAGSGDTAATCETVSGVP